MTDKIIDCPCCHRPTRPPRAKVADYPNTIERSNGKCKTCHVNGVEPGPGRMSIEQIRSALNHWLDYRRSRNNPRRETA